MAMLTVRISTLLATALLGAAAEGSSLYRSESPDGHVVFASQPLDDSYTLYLRDDAPKPEAAAAATKHPPSAARLKAARSLHALIDRLARKHEVDPALVRAIVEVESGANPAAVSHKGARGAMQLMPRTAARYGVTNAADPVRNVEAGILHLKYLLELHQGNLPLALAAYNAGEGSVSKYAKRIPPYRETMLYVPAVLARLQNRDTRE